MSTSVCQFCNGEIKPWKKDGKLDGWVHLKAKDFWRCPELRAEPPVMLPTRAERQLAEFNPRSWDRLMRQKPA